MLVDEWKNLGNDFFRNKKYEFAINAYTEGINLDDTNHVLYANRAAAYLEQGNIEAAKMDAIKCVGLEKTFLKGHYRLISKENALSHFPESNMLLGDWVRAQWSLNDAFKLFPNDSSLQELQKQVHEVLPPGSDLSVPNPFYHQH